VILKKKNKKIVAIIQARMGSKRFPGKMLEKLNGYPILEWVIVRLKKSKYISQIIVATSSLAEDDQIEKVSKNNDVRYFRGDENDVLSRFCEAAKQFNADLVVRVCADNPFIDPFEVDRLIDFYDKNDCDYVCNHMNKLNCGYADGFGAEILSSKLLIDLNKKRLKDDEREHLTLYLHRNNNKYKLLGVPAPAALSFPDLKFDVDSKNDLKRIQKICDLGVDFESLSSDIVKLYNNL